MLPRNTYIAVERIHRQDFGSVLQETSLQIGPSILNLSKLGAVLGSKFFPLRVAPSKKGTTYF